MLDMDGTIVAFRYEADKVKADVRAAVGAAGLPPSLIDLHAPISHSVARVHAHLSAPTDRPLLATLEHQVEGIIQRYELKAASSTHLTRGAVETLQWLSERQVPTALLTNTSRTSLQVLFSRFPIGPYFDPVVCRGETASLKPHPAGLQRILAAWQLAPSEVAFVGDSTIDVECAHAAGVLPIGVTCGLRSGAELEAAGAQHLLPDLGELPQLLRTLGLPAAPAQGNR